MAQCLTNSSFCRASFEPDLAAALWCAENLRALSIFADSGLKRFLGSVVAQCGGAGQYAPPSRVAVVARLDALKEETIEKVCLAWRLLASEITSCLCR